MMKLWLLVRKRGSLVDEKNRPIFAEFDVNDNFVIRAVSEKRARKIASREAADEGAATWMDKRFSTCVLITSEAAEGVVLRSFHAG